MSGAGSAWAWCGSISGCGNVTYQTCELKNSTAQSNNTAPDGFLNFVQGGVRYTSGGDPPWIKLHARCRALHIVLADKPLRLASRREPGGNSQEEATYSQPVMLKRRQAVAEQHMDKS